MSMSIGGIVSGLNTDDIIESFMKIESIPKNQIVTKKSSTETFISALTALNVKLGSMAEQAGKVAKSASFDVWKGTSTDSSVSVTTAEGATATTLEFSVDKLATGKSTLSGALSDASTLLTDGEFTFTTGTGEDMKTFSVTPDSQSLEDLVSSINGLKDSGVKATIIKTEVGQRLQLTSTTTGAKEGTFAISSGSGETGFQTMRQAGDAQITLWPSLGLDGTQVTSASNTFSNVVNGVNITVSKVTSDAVTVDVNRDTAAITKLGTDLVSQVNQVLSEIASRSSVTSSTDDDGNPVTTGGIFTGDTTTRSIVTGLTEAIMHPVNGKSPATIGISLGNDGQLTFDAEKFAKAWQSDPAGTQEFLSELGSRVENVGKSYSDTYEGSLTLRVKSQEALVVEYGKQIAQWDLRLEQRRASLVATYTAMEVALSSLQSQGTSLTSALSSLTSSSSN
ncbi:flagellar filament capping protein FliD [Timonella senegalensis]|uniref:flagellar filament capping protein FliD n=1 Tax=Timonella senegalensis TaxID=1465825 RepID=UPI002FDE95D4